MKRSDDENDRGNINHELSTNRVNIDVKNINWIGLLKDSTHYASLHRYTQYNYIIDNRPIVVDVDFKYIIEHDNISNNESRMMRLHIVHSPSNITDNVVSDNVFDSDHSNSRRLQGLLPMNATGSS